MKILAFLLMMFVSINAHAVQKTITLTITDESTEVDDGISSFSKNHGWTENVWDEETQSDITNPVSSLDYAKSIITSFIADSIKAYNIVVARESAAQAASDAVDVKLSDMVVGVTTD